MYSSSNSNNNITTEWGRYCPNDNLTIYASKLAGCVGMHAYQKQSEFKAEFMRALGQGQGQDQDQYMTSDELAKQELNELPIEIQAKIAQATKATYSNATKVVEAFTKLTADTGTGIAGIAGIANVSTNVIEKIRKEMYTKHGTEQSRSWCRRNRTTSWN